MEPQFKENPDRKSMTVLLDNVKDPGKFLLSNQTQTYLLN
jgi:hypothetical protein